MLSVTQKIVSGATYVSLIGPFMNMYAQIPYAQNSIETAWICNQDRRMKSLWCTTYTHKQVLECIQKYGGTIIELYADGFEFDMWELEKLREQLRNKEEVTSDL